MSDRGGISLLVRNISRRLRPEDLRKEFERYGEIRDVYIPKDFYTKEPKGFAFVEFRSEREAEDARHSLDGITIDGRDIRVVFAQERRKSTDQMRNRERTEKRGGSRRSRSRSPRRRVVRDRSRSRSHRRAPFRRTSRRRSPAKGRSRSRSRSGSRIVSSRAHSPSLCRSTSSRAPRSPHRSASPRRSVSPGTRPLLLSPHHAKDRSRSVSPGQDEGRYHSPLANPRRSSDRD